MTYATTFSGIDAWSVGLQSCGWELLWQCEIDEFCKSYLKWKYGVPIIGSIEQAAESDLEPVDALAISAPCQPFSNSGPKTGTADPRNLWPHVRRVSQRTKPRWILCENVTEIDRMGMLDAMCDDLEADGYEVAPPLEIPAGAVGAKHKRYRTWVVAHSVRSRQPRQGKLVDAVYSAKDCHREADRLVDAFQRNSVPFVCVGHDGFPQAFNRAILHALGNSLHPRIPQIIGQTINQIESITHPTERNL